MSLDPKDDLQRHKVTSVFLGVLHRLCAVYEVQDEHDWHPDRYDQSAPQDNIYHWLRLRITGRSVRYC